MAPIGSGRITNQTRCQALGKSNHIRDLTSAWHLVWLRTLSGSAEVAFRTNRLLVELAAQDFHNKHLSRRTLAVVAIGMLDHVPVGVSLQFPYARACIVIGKVVFH